MGDWVDGRAVAQTLRVAASVAEPAAGCAGGCAAARCGVVGGCVRESVDRVQCVAALAALPRTQTADVRAAHAQQRPTGHFDRLQGCARRCCQFEQPHALWSGGEVGAEVVSGRSADCSHVPAARVEPECDVDVGRVRAAERLQTLTADCACAELPGGAGLQTTAYVDSECVLVGVAQQRRTCVLQIECKSARDSRGDLDLEHTAAAVGQIQTERLAPDAGRTQCECACGA